eukprot:TRINITY_DN2977_c0_g1_i1.p1 TRINITY_DN2977_c0_g1~~TRINITY_DN2977_c0_g1_i1.p1  ORF type:complete len:330 (-),score=88.27 TRINITY_DN2977_c0_g1_i1:77-991(-)
MELRAFHFRDQRAIETFCTGVETQDYNEDDLRLAIRLVTLGAAFCETLDRLRIGVGHRAPSCFISYAWGDPPNVALVLQLEADLRLAGVRTVFDLHQNQSGTGIMRFTNQIGACDRVVLCGTPLLVDKFTNGLGVVAHEIPQIVERAVDELSSGGYHSSVHPLLLAGDPTASIPRAFLRGGEAELVYLDFRDPTAYFDRVLDLLEGLCSSGRDCSVKDVFVSARSFWKEASASVDEQADEINAIPSVLLGAVFEHQLKMVQTASEGMVAEQALEVFNLPLANDKFVARPAVNEQASSHAPPFGH